MTKKKRKIWRFLPYFLATIGIFALVFVGSRDKTVDHATRLSMQSIASGATTVTTDQLSEFYVVANLATYMGLSNMDALSSNYVAMTVMSEVGQSDASRLEKPKIVDISQYGLNSGVEAYQVRAGDSVASIAAAYHLTEQQIRWSNNLKSGADLSVGTIIYIPTVPGIVYTVKSGDSVAGLASKYQSNADQILAANDLNTANLSEGARIVLPSGVLPETERPDYVAPVRTYNYSAPSYSYSYFGSSWDRQNMRLIENWYGRYLPGNKYTPGQCTWYASAIRADLPGNLGNANTWAVMATAQGYTVNRTPAVNSVFQTSAGWVGHVGIVTAVHADGSITVREMNYMYRTFQVVESEIPANQVGNFFYIH